MMRLNLASDASSTGQEGGIRKHGEKTHLKNKPIEQLFSMVHICRVRGYSRQLLISRVPLDFISIPNLSIYLLQITTLDFMLPKP